MTKDQIMRMARKAGMPDPMVFIGAYERFSALLEARVSVAERKACVEACKEQRLLLGEDEAKYASLGIAMCVDAIKTMGIK